MIFLVTGEHVRGGVKNPGELVEAPCQEKRSPWLTPIRWRLPMGWNRALDIAHNLELQNHRLVIGDSFTGLWRARFSYFIVSWARSDAEAKARIFDKLGDVSRRGFSKEIVQLYSELPNKIRSLLGRESPAAETERIHKNFAYKQAHRRRRRGYNPLEDWQPGLRDITGQVGRQFET